MSENAGPPPVPAASRLGRGRLRPGARRRARRVRPRLLVGGRGPLRRFVLPADVRHHRGLPPLLQPPFLPALPRAAIPARVSRPDLGAEGRSLVGGKPSPPPQVLRPARGHPQSPAEGLLVEPHGLDPRAGPRRVGPFAHPRLREVSRAGLAGSEPVRPDAAVRRRALLRVRVDGPLLRLLPVDRPALARHVFDQQRHARLRTPRVRDDRRLAQQLPVRPRHDGRGLAQQPPLGARLGGAGLRLVADRRELLPSLARRKAGPGAGTSPSALREYANAR